MRRFGCVRGSICLAAWLTFSGVGAAEDEAPVETVQPAAGINPLRLANKPRGKTTGRWVEWRAGAKWEGAYLDGKRHGVWEGSVPVQKDTLFAEPEYAGFEGPFALTIALHLNVPHGEMTAVDAQQRPVFTWHFDQGVLEGKATWWHPNGQARREVTYRAGLLDGPVTEWNADGKETSQETYREGRGSGSHIDWYSPGQKRYEGYSELAGEVTRDSFDWTELRWSQSVVHEFDAEQRCGRWTAWYPNGQKKVQGGYQDGEAEGHFTWWYENGQKMAEGEYQAGQKHGGWRWWHSNGRKQLEGRYQLGQAAGDWEAWASDGRPASVDRSKVLLALEWDQKASETLVAKRSAAPARPVRSDASKTVATAPASTAPVAKSIVKPDRQTASSKTTASPTSPAPVKSSKPTGRISNSNTPPAGRTAMTPSTNRARAATEYSQQGGSDDFTLLGIFIPETTTAGGQSQGLFKSKTPAPSWGTAPSRQSVEYSDEPAAEAPRSILTDLLGVQPAPPPYSGPKKPIRR